MPTDSASRRLNCSGSCMTAISHCALGGRSAADHKGRRRPTSCICALPSTAKQLTHAWVERVRTPAADAMSWIRAGSRGSECSTARASSDALRGLTAALLSGIFVLVAMLVLGVFFFQIREQFDGLDLHHLETLKEEQ